MQFLKSEVENKERISLTTESLGLGSEKNRSKKVLKQCSKDSAVLTAAELIQSS